MSAGPAARSTGRPVGRRPVLIKGGGSVAPPAQFGAGDWLVADRNTVDGATITVTTLPSDGGSAITDLEYQVNGGSWVSLGGSATGDYAVVLPIWNVAYAIALRAVNAIGNGTASATKTVTPTGSADTDALNARCSTPLTTADAKLYQTLYASLRIGATSGSDLVSKGDYLRLYCAVDAQVAKLNLLSSLYNATEVNAPTFKQYRGFAGDGSSSSLRSNYNPSTAPSPKATQNSVCLVIGDRTSRGSAEQAQMGGRSGSTDFLILTRGYGGNNCLGRNNDMGVAVANSNSDGLFFSNRTGSGSRQAFRNNVSLGSIVVSTNGLLNAEVYELSISGVSYFSSDQLWCAGIFAGMTTAEMTDLHNALTTFKTAVGA